jgi:hypothetical protein
MILDKKIRDKKTSNKKYYEKNKELHRAICLNNYYKRKETEPPQYCEFCDKSYISLKNLEKHLKTDFHKRGIIKYYMRLMPFSLYD